MLYALYYIIGYIIVGPTEGVPVSSLPVCLQRLKLSYRELHRILECIYMHDIAHNMCHSLYMMYIIHGPENECMVHFLLIAL